MVTVTEACAIGVVCKVLAGKLDHDRELPTADELVSALAMLAESANKRLQAGYSGGIVVAREKRVRAAHARLLAKPARHVL
jgi:hypothetical protein